ncbi:MAG: hypothetical protein AAF652_18035 [Cyanobacteria bacterium P01_C01_bin.72]
MPTDNPKISLYVPQQIYDRFKSFQKEKKLSMSQAGIVILAEYFGLEETIKEFTEGTTVGGVTLAEFEGLKKEFQELKEQVKLNRSFIDKIPGTNYIEVEDRDKTTSEPPENKDLKSVTSNLQLKLTHDSNRLTLKTATLAKRFGLKVNSVSSAKNRRKTPESFCEWSKTKDPDGIGWIPINKHELSPVEDLAGELLSKLQKWIQGNG